MIIKCQFKPVLIALGAVGLIATSPMAVASERESLEQLRTTTLSLIELLVQEGVLSKAKAEVLVKQAESVKVKVRTADASSANDATQSIEDDEKVVRVQYVPEFVKNQMREEIKQEVMAKAQSEGWAYPGSIPEWLNRIAWEGNLRLRYELDSFPTGNAPAVFFRGDVTRNANITNTTENRNRFRVRAQLGANLTLTDWLTGGIRMTTGKIDDPVSPNQTLQTADSKYSFALDRAYLKAQPYSWMSVVGGRFENPWFSTDMVWDPDLAFDGIAATFKPKFTNEWSAFGTVGAFPIEEIQKSETNSTRDKWMFGAQAGLEWKSAGNTTAKFGVALYDYKNIEGTPNTLLEPDKFDGTVPAFRQKGNSTFDIDAATGTPGCGFGTANNRCGLASKFRELNLTGQLDLAAFNPVHVILSGDYVRNIGFDRNEILQRTGIAYAKENEGYQVKLTVGMPQTLKRNDWQVFGAYKRLEADAVLDAFTDSDFHLGGTDTKGWIVGASYGVDKNTWVTARWFSADQITGLPLATDVLLVDLNAKF